MTRKVIGKQLAYLRRDLDAIDGKLSLGKNLPPRQTERLGTIRAVYEQQKYMYDNRTRSVPDRTARCSITAPRSLTCHLSAMLPPLRQLRLSPVCLRSRT